MRNTCRTSLGFLALHGWPDWVLLTWVPLQTWEGYPDWVLYRLIIGANSEEHGSEDLLIDEVDFAPLSLAQFPRTGRGEKVLQICNNRYELYGFLMCLASFSRQHPSTNPMLAGMGFFPFLLHEVCPDLVSGHSDLRRWELPGCSSFRAATLARSHEIWLRLGSQAESHVGSEWFGLCWWYG